MAIVIVLDNGRPGPRYRSRHRGHPGHRDYYGYCARPDYRNHPNRRERPSRRDRLGPHDQHGFLSIFSDSNRVLNTRNVF